MVCRLCERLGGLYIREIIENLIRIKNITLLILLLNESAVENVTEHILHGKDFSKV